MIPLASICCITYNHQDYIQDALDSFEMQEINFPIEIIIYDDCSTDKTREKLLKFKESSKHTVKLLLAEENRFSKGDRIFPKTILEAKGKYIALCEGDDYWTDPLKLQKQVDFLEANPEYVIHSGMATVLKESGECKHDPFSGIRDVAKTFNLEDFLGKNNLITCTVVFRNCLTQIPEAIKKVTFGDWFLYTVLLHQTGLKAYRDTKVLSVYRVHDKGFMWSLSSVNYFQRNIHQVLEIKRYIGYKRNPPSVIQWINNYSIPKFRYELAHKMYKNALKTFMDNLNYCKFGVSVKRYLSVLKHNKWL